MCQEKRFVPEVGMRPFDPQFNSFANANMPNELAHIESLLA